MVSTNIIQDFSLCHVFESELDESMHHKPTAFQLMNAEPVHAHAMASVHICIEACYSEVFPFVSVLTHSMLPRCMLHYVRPAWWQGLL